MTPISFEECSRAVLAEMSAMRLPVIMGKTVNGRMEVMDLSMLESILISGATSQGKTNFIHNIIESIVKFKTPQQVQFVLCDPKCVEFSDMPATHLEYVYKSEKIENRIFESHDDIVAVLEYLIDEMHSRMDSLKSLNKQNLLEYNEVAPDKITDIVIVIDEIADLVTVNEYSKDLIVRLAMFGSMVGMYFIISTQMPSESVVSWKMRVNFLTKISFKVHNNLDSIRIVNSSNATKLNWPGEMIVNYHGGKQILYQTPLICW